MFKHISALGQDDQPYGLVTIEQTSNNDVIIRYFDPPRIVDNIVQWPLRSEEGTQVQGRVVQAHVSKNGSYILLISQDPENNYSATVIYSQEAAKAVVFRQNAGMELSTTLSHCAADQASGARVPSLRRLAWNAYKPIFDELTIPPQDRRIITMPLHPKVVPVCVFISNSGQMYIATETRFTRFELSFVDNCLKIVSNRTVSIANIRAIAEHSARIMCLQAASDGTAVVVEYDPMTLERRSFYRGPQDMRLDLQSCCALCPINNGVIATFNQQTFMLRAGECRRIADFPLTAFQPDDPDCVNAAVASQPDTQRFPVIYRIRTQDGYMECPYAGRGIPRPIPSSVTIRNVVNFYPIGPDDRAFWVTCDSRSSIRFFHYNRFARIERQRGMLAQHLGADLQVLSASQTTNADDWVVIPAAAAQPVQRQSPRAGPPCPIM